MRQFPLAFELKMLILGKIHPRLALAEKSPDGRKASFPGWAMEQLLSLKAPSLPLVIPTEAYPDFLLRAASNDHVCGSP